MSEYRIIQVETHVTIDALLSAFPPACSVCVRTGASETIISYTALNAQQGSGKHCS